MHTTNLKREGWGRDRERKKVGKLASQWWRGTVCVILLLSVSRAHAIQICLDRKGVNCKNTKFISILKQSGCLDKCYLFPVIFISFMCLKTASKIFSVTFPGTDANLSSPGLGCLRWVQYLLFFFQSSHVSHKCHDLSNMMESNLMTILHNSLVCIPSGTSAWVSPFGLSTP